MNESLRIVGQPVVRIDAASKVTGQYRFMSDLKLPNALWAVIVRSPHARANVRTLDPNPALEIEGVLGVYTSNDVPDVLFNTAGAPPSVELDTAADCRLLTNSAQHVGDRVAVVVADTQAKARAGSRAVQIDWEILPPILDPEEALAQGNVLGRVGMGDEAVDEVLAGADLVVTGRYYTQAVQHVCLETHACAAFLDPVDNRLTIWSNTQTPSDVRRLCSEILGIPMARLRVRKINEGGGFGCKQELFEEALVGWLAMQLRRPVQLHYTRLEEFTASRNRHGSRLDVRLGFAGNGRLLVCEIEALLDSGAYASHAPYVIGDLLSVAYYNYPQAIHRLAGTVVQTNTLPGGAYRGYGVPQALFALEQSMDEAAQQLGLDPVELRRRNTTPVTSDEDPFFGQPATGRLRKCLDIGTQVFGWSNMGPKVGQDGWTRAEGVAVTTMLNVTSFGTHEETSATVRWNEDGTVTLLTGTCDCGTGSSTVLAQIVAEELNIPVHSVHILEGDTDSGLVDLGSFSQRTLFVGGGAVRQAAKLARRRILEAVAIAEARFADHLSIQNGCIIDISDTDFVIPIGVFCRKQIARGSIIGMASFRPQGDPPSYGVCFVQVAVDLETGAIRVERCMSVADCGRVLNPLGAAGQVHGGVVQGLGFALIEHWSPDNNGLGPRTIHEHGLPNTLDVPSIHALFIDNPDALGPYGAKGLGEVPLPPVAAAVANALARASGIRFERLPLRPAEVWQAFQSRIFESNTILER